jgi:hypothetical protein
MLYIAREQFYETILMLPENKDYDRQLAGLDSIVYAVQWWLFNTAVIAITESVISTLPPMPKE